MNNWKFTVPVSASAFILLTSCAEKVPNDLPNILWITSEDNSPFLGCYGDSFATTPNLDRLASEGILYTHAVRSSGCDGSRGFV